jgi:hypothetical protein
VDQLAVAKDAAAEQIGGSVRVAPDGLTTRRDEESLTSGSRALIADRAGRIGRPVQIIQVWPAIQDMII